MRNFLPLLLLCISGCQSVRDTSPERATAAVAVAIAKTTVGVVPWTEQLPLIMPSDESDEPDEPVTEYAEPVSDPPKPTAKPRAKPISTPVAARSIDWQQAYGPAHTKAKAANKPLWIHFIMDGCIPCQRLEKNVFTNQELVSLSEKFVCLKVNGPKRPDLVEQFKLKGFYPCDTFLYPNGDYETYLDAPKTADGYLDLLENVEREAKKTTWLPGPFPKYPIRGSLWTGCTNWSHMTKGPHKKHNLDPEWLKQLSWRELQSVHSDSHEGKLKLMYCVTKA